MGWLLCQSLEFFAGVVLYLRAVGAQIELQCAVLRGVARILREIETVGVNKAGQDYKLSDYLQVKTLSQEASLIGDISFFALDRCSIGCYNAKSKKSYTNPTERSEYMGRNDRYFMSSVKIGPKGQIVIPKEARDMFGLEPGDTLVLMADKKKGLALQTVDKLNPLMKTVFNSLPSEAGEVDDE